MANRIKGITVEIGGDTTGLDKALKGVNSTIKSTQSQLRDVNRLLKLDPSNAKLLAQKQQLLQKEISETSNKLNALKEADKQAKVQLANGELGQDKYDALQREIIETENQLKSLQDEVKKVPSAIAVSMKEAGDKIRAVGDKTTQVGKTLSTAVTAPIVGLGAASIAAFNEIDKGMDIIVSKTGASGKELKSMQDSMKKLATSIPTDFETAGAAIGEVNTRFGLTGDKLEELSSKFIKFAKLNNVDVSSAIDNTQKVISAFGLKAEDTSSLLDTLNAVGQRTGISMDTLAKSMVTNAASLQQLGFSASDAANFLGNVEISGADTSQVMTGLTKALSSATANGKSMKEALSEIQNKMVNAKTDTEGLQFAYELFGKRAGGAIYQACKNGSLSFEELGTSLKDNIGNIDKTFKETLDPIDEFKMSMNSLKVVGAEVGSSLLTILRPAIEKISSVLKSLSEKWNSLSPGMQDAIIKIGLIAATVGPVFIIIGKVISAVGVITSALGPLIGIITGTTAATTAAGIAGSASAVGTAAAGTAAGGAAIGFGALSTALLPIIGIIAAVVAAIAGIILIIKNWGSICSWFKNLWSSICEGVKSIGTGLGNFFSSLWDSIKTTTQNKWNEIKDSSFVLWNNMKETCAGVFNFIKSGIGNTWETLKSMTSQTWQNIKSSIESHGGGIKGIIGAATSAYVGIYKGAYDKINQLTGGRLGDALGIVIDKLSSIKDAFVNKLSAARDFVGNVIGRIKSFFNFSWSLPRLKLPHLNISGSFSLMPPRVPHFSIDWYKKAMNKPMLLNGATIFGQKGNTLLGGGEAGPEVIMGLDTLNNMTQGSNTDLLNVMTRVLEIMDMYFPKFSDTSIVLDSGELVGSIASKMDMELGKLQNKKARGW